MEPVPALTASANGLWFLVKNVPERTGTTLPEVQLVHGLVVDVGAHTLGNVEAISLSLRCLTEMLLFVANVMLCACNDSSILNASNSRADQCSRQIWIWTETLLR
jgi:hypothetical protein